MHKAIIIFFGPPASGKGTQTKLLEKELKIPVISTGELLRNEIENHTELSKKVIKTIDAGKLVPSRIVDRIFEKRLREDDIKKGFILDGYPRNQIQLNYLKKRLSDFSKEGYVIIAVDIEIRNKTAIHRITGRLTCGCGMAYHIKNNPPKKKGICDKCGEKLYRRKDDHADIVRARLEDYHRRTQPIIEFFKKNYILKKINGEEGIKKVHINVLKELKKDKVI